MSWQPPPGTVPGSVVAYDVQAYSGSVGLPVVRFNSTATTQTITGLTNGTTYTFHVRAIHPTRGKTAWSDPSNPVTPATVPGEPTGVTAVGGDASASVSWTAPASDGGSAVTGYAVTPYIGAVAQTPVIFSSTVTTQDVTGLTNGTTYTFTGRGHQRGRDRQRVGPVEPGDPGDACRVRRPGSPQWAGTRRRRCPGPRPPRTVVRR